MTFINIINSDSVTFCRILPFFLYALISAYTDLKSRSISLVLSLFAAAAGIWFLYIKDPGIKETAASILPGISLLILSFLSHGCIGIGDAVYITICGLYIGSADTIVLVMAAWLISAAAALFLAASGRTHKVLRSSGLPFASICFPILLFILAGRLIRL